MPQKCCVPFCKGNYNGENKVTVFSFPQDEFFKQKWIRAIKRKNFNPTKNNKVSLLHYWSLFSFTILYLMLMLHQNVLCKLHWIILELVVARGVSERLKGLFIIIFMSFATYAMLMIYQNVLCNLYQIIIVTFWGSTWFHTSKLGHTRLISAERFHYILNLLLH